MESITDDKADGDDNDHDVYIIMIFLTQQTLAMFLPKTERSRNVQLIQTLGVRVGGGRTQGQ